MTRMERWFLAACLGLGLLLGPFALIAQQQYSGGQAVTVTSGNVAVTQSGTWTVQPGNTANTTAWKVDGSAVTQPVSGTFFQATQPISMAAGLAAGTNTIGNTRPWTPCGATSFETGTPAGVAAMPTSSTAVAAATTCALTIIVANTSGGTLTYTISDNAGTPINFVNAVSILAGERNEYTFPNGLKFNAGIKVQASGSGLTYYINGLQ